MPQLDRLGFVSEVIWLIFMFLGIYLFLVKNGLEIIYKILFYRRSLLSKVFSDILSLEKEFFFIEHTFLFYISQLNVSVYNTSRDIVKLGVVEANAYKEEAENFLLLDMQIESLSTLDELVLESAVLLLNEKNSGLIASVKESKEILSI